MDVSGSEDLQAIGAGKRPQIKHVFYENGRARIFGGREKFSKLSLA